MRISKASFHWTILGMTVEKIQFIEPEPLDTTCNGTCIFCKKGLTEMAMALTTLRVVLT